MNEEHRNLAVDAGTELARIKAIDAPEVEARLSREASAIGCKIKRKGRGASRFEFVDPKGNSLVGITLADIDGILAKTRRENS
jgi:hypothetical protein